MSVQHSDERNLLDRTGLCLLSLDGGGVRGLSTLYILRNIMKRLNHERRTTNLPPVKPCEVFDLIGGTSTGGVKAQFDSSKLEKAIRETIKRLGISDIDSFNDGNNRGFICTIDQNTKSIVYLRSYESSDESNIPASICQAALATSATTTFFEPIHIRNRIFADSGLGANNPVDEVEGEAANI
ncbi:acyl transferase/acyl hydrolase/lysophospholipase [Hyaloscypha sp. PMI_1271]|nr:acyl transferase/acyl hydrolase/lysophospholipase [Hyaloscypha sp. PMI_1271]